MTRKRLLTTLLVLCSASGACQQGGSDRRASSPHGISAAPAPNQAPAETTIRNATEQTIAYTVSRVDSSERGEPRQLEPGAVDRFPASHALVVGFRSGEQEMSYELYPSLPYTFRPGDDGQVDLFGGSHGRADVADLAPFLPTPMAVVRKMLELAEVGPEDVLYDIGCGDGRVVIEAAKRRGARGVGIDLDEQLVRKARALASQQGVQQRVEFLVQDATKSDFSRATVVALYLLPESNALLRPIMERQLRPGARVVSHNYPVPGWEQKLVGATVMDDEGDEGHSIFLYRR